MQLIIPMAGSSTRFPGVKPKWMLTHPSGQYMALEAIQGLPLDNFEKLHFVYLQEHEDKFHFLKGFQEEIESLGLKHKAVMTPLPEATKDQPETVLRVIAMREINGPILIKDSDNYLKAEIPEGNSVCFGSLNECGLIKPQNKSYIEVTLEGFLTNIVEKQVVSPYFCVGAYGFREAGEFVRACEALPMNHGRYISNIIYQLILEGVMFRAVPTVKYNDWGTLEDWRRFQSSYATVFVDLDGTLFKNSSSHFPPYVGESEVLEDNMKAIRELQGTGRFEIIVTTARAERFRDLTLKQLAEHGVTPNHLMMGLQHSKRIIINDYAKSNPYKSCDAVNLKRNSDNLRELLQESLGIDFDGQ